MGQLLLPDKIDKLADKLTKNLSQQLKEQLKSFAQHNSLDEITEKLDIRINITPKSTTTTQIIHETREIYEPTKRKKKKSKKKKKESLDSNGFPIENYNMNSYSNKTYRPYAQEAASIPKKMLQEFYIFSHFLLKISIQSKKTLS